MPGRAADQVERFESYLRNRDLGQIAYEVEGKGLIVSKAGDVVLALWLDVLRAGGTLPPLELMRQVGIDLSSAQPIRDAVAYVGRLIEELEASF